MNIRGGSMTVATSKMERFVIIVNGWKPIDPVLNIEGLTLNFIFSMSRSTIVRT